MSCRGSKKCEVVLLFIILSLPMFAQKAMKNNKAIRMHTASNMASFGDLINNGDMTKNLGNVLFVGPHRQTISGTSVTEFNDIIFKNFEGISLQTSMIVTDKVIFETGIITTPRNNPGVALTFAKNTTYEKVADTKHINGYCTKIGKDSFDFPIGNGIVWRSASISASGSNNNIVKAAYFDKNPGQALLPAGAPFSVQSLDLQVLKVSNVEYWHINSSSSLRVTLTWNSTSNVDTLIENILTDLIVAGWDGQKWTSIGAENIIGDVTQGRITSRLIDQNKFSIFTLAKKRTTQRCTAPTLNVGNDILACGSKPVKLHAGNAYSKYNWSNGSTDSVISVSNTGIYKVTVTDYCGIKQSDMINVRFLQAPNLAIFGTRNICDGQNVNLTATNGFDVYKWETDNGVVCANCKTLNQKPVGISNRYYLTAYSTNGCSVMDTAVINVNPVSESVLDTTLCAGESLRLGGVSYKYAGTYKVRLPNSFGCDSIITLTLRQKSNISTTSTDISCYGNTDGKIILNTDTTKVKLFVNNNLTYFSSLNNLGSGDYHIRVANQNSVCALVDTTIHINQPSIAHLQISNDSIHLPNPGDRRTVSVTPLDDYLPINYSWTPPDAVSCASCSTTVISVKKSGLVTVFSVDKKGCRANASVDVYVDDQYSLYVPNAFKPEREFYTVLGSETIEIINYMRIFDRWGELVYEATNFKPDGSVGWDGTFRGQPMNTGTFVVTVEATFKNGVHKTYASDVLLTR